MVYSSLLGTNVGTFIGAAFFTTVAAVTPKES